MNWIFRRTLAACTGVLASLILVVPASASTAPQATVHPLVSGITHVRQTVGHVTVTATITVHIKPYSGGTIEWDGQMCQPLNLACVNLDGNWSIASNWTYNWLNWVYCGYYFIAPYNASSVTWCGSYYNYTNHAQAGENTHMATPWATWSAGERINMHVYQYGYWFDYSCWGNGSGYCD
jgi:hypothetical protein